MPKHALLSASASHRWLNCPPSAKLCADIKDEASPYAKQGTDAHSLCEFKVLTALGQHPPDPTDDLDYFDQEMAYCTDEYCSYVMEQLTEAKTHCKDPQVLVEQRLDFSKWIPEGFGTGDCLIVADDVLHIIDFKYGLGVGITWSLELYQQTVARLWRQGQTEGTVSVIHIVTDGTVDERILKALEAKDLTQSALIDAVKAEVGDGK